MPNLLLSHNVCYKLTIGSYRSFLLFSLSLYLHHLGCLRLGVLVLGFLRLVLPNQLLFVGSRLALLTSVAFLSLLPFLVLHV